LAEGDDMTAHDEKLSEISTQIDKGLVPKSVSARDFIWWFGAQRRSSWNVEYIRDALKRYKLITVPDFEYMYIDSFLTFERAPQKVKKQEIPLVQDTKDDPTYRIGKLASANKTPVFVKPDDQISTAITLMITHDFSQLPVMTSEREVKGMISWKSLASKKHLSGECNFVRECMEPASELSYDTYIFSAIEFVIDHEYALIRANDKTICGIVTTSDLGQEFRDLGEPYLLLGEIEKYIRRMFSNKYDLQDIQKALNPTDNSRNVEKVSDLTLGEYIRFIENPDNWEKLELNIDREVFTTKLTEIRNIRNDVMHFDTDNISKPSVDKLRDFIRLLQHLARFGAI
jgi:CBS domain-containing protein